LGPANRLRFAGFGLKAVVVFFWERGALIFHAKCRILTRSGSAWISSNPRQNFTSDCKRGFPSRISQFSGLRLKSVALIG
jgi:hypothetical protein